MVDGHNENPYITKDTYNKISSDVNAAKPAGNRVLPIVIIIAAVLLLIYFLSRGCNKKDDTSTTPATTDTETVMKTPAPAPMAERESMKVKLPDGTEIEAYKGGIEDQLVACLNDA
ncbi:MAG: hypothetical protein ACMG51_02215 [Ginsengibacter sp.]